jgi:hypothetical protein
MSDNRLENMSLLRWAQEWNTDHSGRAKAGRPREPAAGG